MGNTVIFGRKYLNMKILYPLLTLLAFAVMSCEQKRPVDRFSDEQLKAYADELAHRYIITDGHVDLPYRLKMKNFRPEREYMGIPISSKEGDFDYERAKMGGLDAPFMSIYIPASNQHLDDKGSPIGGGKELADSLINMVTAIAGAHPDKFALAKTPQDIQEAFKAGKIALPMGMENGAPVGMDLANLKDYFEKGIRYITLTHGRDNQICDSSGDTTRTWNGLSPFGKQVVAEMNRLGIMVDISHVDDSTFYQVMKLTKAPCIASHSSCRYFAPTVRRDMTDDMIRELGKNDGVVMINFYNAFLDSTVVNQNKKNRIKLTALLDERKLNIDDDAAKPIIEQFKKDNPSLRTDVEMVANHIDHVVQLAGIDHVGIGSDFDGVDGELPTGLTDVSTYPTLIYTLLKRGYTEQDIEKICSGNLFRVWNKVIEVASK